MQTTTTKLLYKLYDSPIGVNALALYILFWSIITSRHPIGKNIFDEEWDLLIVLDACRVDALGAVESEYSYLNEIEKIWSIGSTSKEWIDRTFTHNHSDEIQRTAYVTANPFSDQIRGEEINYLDYDPIRESFITDYKVLNKIVKNNTVTADEFTFYDPAWYSIDMDSRETDLNIRTPLPNEVTDRAIATSREVRPDRMIVHYMQPHQPYLASAVERGHIESWEKSPFKALRNNDKTFETVQKAYINNLRYVLDHVEVILRNVDAPRVVITSDHGELFGELGLYSHLVGLLHPKLRTVPWVETSARDTQEYTPTVNLETPHKDKKEDISGHLEALGYLR